MRKTLLTLAALGALAGNANATSGVNLYGLVDTTIRFSTHENAAGDSKYQMSDGVLTGSRWGMYGIEDLGGSYQALFVLESGFAPDTGNSLQGNRLFGRKAYVGLQGDFGTVTLGRQFTVIHEAIAANDAMALANLGLVGFQGGNYTGGVRQDNMVKYTGVFGGLTVSAQHAFGEVAGSFARSSSTGGSLFYAAGPFKVGGGYQVIRNTTTYFVPTPNSDQKTWTVGGTYKAGPATLFLNYADSRVDGADYHDQTVDVGINYAFNQAWSLIALTNFDHLKHANTSGNRVTASVMLDYAFSKRTDVYLESDFTKLNGAWRTLGAQPNFTTPFFGQSTRLGVMAGLRHKF